MEFKKLETSAGLSKTYSDSQKFCRNETEIEDSMP
jgi:hypothetical protein